MMFLVGYIGYRKNVYMTREHVSRYPAANMYTTEVQILGVFRLLESVRVLLEVSTRTPNASNTLL